MSVAYEPRNFIHEENYPPLGDDHDHAADQRFVDSEVAEQLSHYAAEDAMIQVDGGVIGDERDMLGEDDVVKYDPGQLDLDVAGFPSPLQVALHVPLPDAVAEIKEASPGIGSPAALRSKTILKPEREVHKESDGKFHCPLEDCKEETRAFSRKCEWNKHMDKHERPYRCPAEGCENLPGFTYSGGLLRHEREVHGKHGGPKKTVNCPHPNCKRNTGKGFSRQENLNEHLRRVHTNMNLVLATTTMTTTTTTTPPAPPAPEMPTSHDGDDDDDENGSEKSGVKRKREAGDSSELAELREEIKRVREENEKLKSEMEQQSLAMMAQMTQLQEAMRHGLGGPTAHLI